MLLMEIVQSLLYHVTHIGNALDILDDNVLKATYRGKDSLDAVSLTRNLHYNINQGVDFSVRFALDKNKLRTKYKIIPHADLYWRKSKIFAGISTDEFEEIINADIIDFDNYLVNISIPDYDEYYDTFESMHRIFIRRKNYHELHDNLALVNELIQYSKLNSFDREKLKNLHEFFINRFAYSWDDRLHSIEHRNSKYKS